MAEASDADLPTFQLDSLAAALPDTGTSQELDERACGDHSSCKDTTIRSIGIFPILVWEKIFTHIKYPLDIQSLCNASEDLNQILDDSGRKGQDYFLMIYPLIHPYLDTEIELLTRDETQPSMPPVLLERASEFKDALNQGVFGSLRSVCPNWRKIIWKNAISRLRKKYRILPRPLNIPTRPGAKYLILKPRIVTRTEILPLLPDLVQDLFARLWRFEQEGMTSVPTIYPNFLFFQTTRAVPANTPIFIFPENVPIPFPQN